MTQQAPPLPYETPPPPSPMRPVAKFLIGLIGGSAVSAIVYPVTMAKSADVFMQSCMVVGTIKILLVLVLLAPRHTRMLAAGITVSFAVGALIFLTTCGAAISGIK